MTTITHFVTIEAVEDRYGVEGAYEGLVRCDCGFVMAQRGLWEPWSQARAADEAAAMAARHILNRGGA